MADSPPLARSLFDAEMRLDLQGRVLALFLPGSLLAGVLLTLLAEAMGWPVQVSVFGFFLTVLPLAVWLLLGRFRGAALWLLLLSYTAIALAGPRWLGTGAAGILLVAPGGLAALLLGPRHGLGVAAALTVAILAAGARLGLSDPLTRLVLLGVIWAEQILLWAALAYAGQAVEWWSNNYDHMRALLEAARTQRVELKQTQEDLIQANLELARVSERLRAMREVAEEARLAKEQFVANVSHELRTPLNMIIGFSEMIIQAPHVYSAELPPKLLADIEIVLSSSRHLASLVDDVLDLSQVDSGRMALSRTWNALPEIVQAAALAVTPLFQSKGLALRLDVPADLPVVYCDAVRVRQVILNLLSNAGRFTDRGGATLTVVHEGAELVVSVADTGPGIALEDQERIFERFSQADGSIRRRYGGSGLGLAISKRFVELHEGRMWFESQLGQGTTFHFSLPIEGVARQGSATVARWFSPYLEYQERGRPSRAPKPELTPRYVVMESGDTLRRLLARYRQDAQVVSVHSIEDAVREVSELPAHALILNDRSLSGSAGPDERLAHLPYGTPVIGCWVPGRQEAAEQLGLVRYLMKPVRREELLNALEALPGPIKTVLVVDDEPEALQLYARILASAERGYRVLRAPTGQRALTLMRERHPDAVLLDLVMPGMDGYAALRAKSLDPAIRHIPAIAISAQDPSQGPIASNLLTVARSGGLFLQDLLTAIEAISQLLAPPDQLADRERAKSPLD